MKKILLWMLVLFSIVIILIRFSGRIGEAVFDIRPRSGISIFTTPDTAKVFLDGQEAGKTHFENNDLNVKEYNIKLDKDGASWQGKVKLNPGTITIINRDLATNNASSSGEILSLDRGRGITVISNPANSEVEIDGKVYGKTPISVNITPGAHTILISHPNYLKRSIRANLPNNFNLTVSIDLAISEIDLTTIAAPVVTQTPEIIVKQTPTGFLRVRDKGSLQGKEITRVDVGEKLILLEELGGWDRVRLANGTEGFVSANYVEKVTP